MFKYIVKRLIYCVLVLLGVSLICFFIIYLSPGDPVELLLGEAATPELIAAKRAELGFDRPYMVQYGTWLLNVLRGNLGTSLYYHESCWTIIKPMLWKTVQLTFSAMLLSLIISIPLGLLAGVKRGSGIDFFSMGFAMLGQACSSVWLGIVLVMVFAVKLKLFPPYGDTSFAHIIMPSITLGAPLAAITVRMVRSGMIDTLDSDYILAARAKGEPNFKVITKYAFKNALLPVITVVGLQLGQFLGGAVVTEQIFAWNGIGKLMVSSLNGRDYPMIQASLLISSSLFVIVNVLVDLLYTVVDPRMRKTSSGKKRIAGSTLSRFIKSRKVPSSGSPE